MSSLAELDAAHLIHPHAVVGSPGPPLVWARGKGALLWDVDGREYVDGTCGLWQCAVGHGREELARVAAEQMATLEFYASFWNFARTHGSRSDAVSNAHIRWRRRIDSASPLSSSISDA